MEIQIRELSEAELEAAAEIWNSVVEEGNAFPQREPLDLDGARCFFAGQSFTGIAADKDSGETLGVYILHPNNVGRCGHICNASYAVRKDARGRKIGGRLVAHSMERAKILGFKILQFNAVVRSNAAALALYKKLGFEQLGVIPGGFLNKSGRYEDIIVHYIAL